MVRKRLAAAGLTRSLRSSVCLAGLSLLPLACASYHDSVVPTTTTPNMTAAPVAPVHSIQLVKADVGQELPGQLPDSILPPSEPAHPVALTLGTIFRLAEDQNAQIALSRAKIDEACASRDLADKAWLPQVSVGSAWFRHEGGIANQDGTLQRSSFGSFLIGGDLIGKLDLKEAVYQRFVAERQVLQQKGELRKVTTETLLDAANAYIDLLAARTGETMALESKKQLETLLERAQRAVASAPQAAVEVANIKATLRNHEMLISQLQEEAARISAKLVYLLGLDSSATIVVADDHLVPLDLIDPNKPVAELVSQALTMGPGIQEMERMLAQIDEGICQSNGPIKYMPTLEMHMLEGAFGTGPGGSTTWDNRFDLGLQARWDLTQFLTQQERQHVMRAKTEQAHLSYKDLRAKLSAGVQESREVVVRGKNQIRLGEEAIAEAKYAQKLTEDRKDANLPGATYFEIVQSQHATALARAGYLAAVRAYDQAQMRLFLLTGSGPHSMPGANNSAAMVGKPE
jgi:outer membrane protein TolC